MPTTDPHDNPAQAAREQAEATPLTPEQAQAEQQALQAARTRTRRSFIGLGLAGLAGAWGWHYFITPSAGNPDVAGATEGVRKVLGFNHELTKDYFSHTRLAPEFARSRAVKLRLNGDIGLTGDFDPAAWRLVVQGYAPGGTAPRRQEFTLEQIKALPRTEMTTQLKCIEGWSVIVHWAGARLSDFLARYPLATASGQPIANLAQPPADTARYAGLVTPDGQYYAGLEMYSALHPQTLLAYELNGVPLTLEHGAPLRLVTPLKYGVKHLKRIGTLTFTDQRPRDYWAERGYDWSGGH